MEHISLEDYFRILKDQLSDKALETTLVESDSGCELLLSVASPFEDSAPVGYRISIAETEQDAFLLGMVIALFTDISDELTSPLERIAERMNAYLTIGAFAVIENTFLLRYERYIDPQTTYEDLSIMIGSALSLMEHTAADGGSMAYRLISGKSTEYDIINDISENMGETI